MSEQKTAGQKYAEMTRIERFAHAVCSAWCDDCVMDDHEKPNCNAKNCMVYPIAARMLGQLDARAPFIKQERESETVFAGKS